MATTADCVSERPIVPSSWTIELHCMPVTGATCSWPCSSRSELASGSPVRTPIDYSLSKNPGRLPRGKPRRVLFLLPDSVRGTPRQGPAGAIGLHPGAIRQAVRKERISVLVCVPRILESLRADIERRHLRSNAVPANPGGPLRRWWRHRDIHRAFGLKFWAFVVGGAMLDPETEAFWSKIGLLVIQGYGLTETSPVVSVNHPFRARRGTLGEVKWLRNGGQLRLRQMRQRSNCVWWCRIHHHQGGQ